MENKKKFYQISEAARACGISRSTIMRMEEKKLLKPAYISEQSGRRYYDNFNIARIIQIEKFKTMGLTPKQIIDYYQSGGDVEELINSLENKISALNRSLEELKQRKENKNVFSVSEMILPEVVCRMKRCEGLTINDKYNAMYDFYTECILSGWELSDEPIFTISDRNDFLDGVITQDIYPFYVCVPVKAKIKDAVIIPSCKVLSVLYYGDYKNVDSAWLKLGYEVKKRNYKTIGMPRVLGIVAPYTGKEISETRYSSRFVVPIE